jgi:hypothetical protein
MLKEIRRSQTEIAKEQTKDWDEALLPNHA